jgi:hypothetical protein
MVSAGWNGLGVGLANVWRLADAETRSISPENPTGARGRGGTDTEGVASAAAAGLGQGWKISPYVKIAPGAEHVLADIDGSGTIQHIWLTPTGGWRNQILRMWWDDDPNRPSCARSATSSPADGASTPRCRRWPCA